MTETPQVHQAIAAVIADLPAIGKDSQITDGPQKYHYRGIEQIKAELKPVMAAHGVHYAPHQIREATDEPYQTKSGATWQRTRLIVTFRIYGADGSFIEAEGRGEGADNSDKAQNKALTGAEKQMLLQVFCIADSEDPDSRRPPEQQVHVVVISREQANRRVLHELKENGWNKEAAIAKAAVLMAAVVGDGPFPEADWADVFSRAAAAQPVGPEAV